jgi:hypothetical protein
MSTMKPLHTFIAAAAAALLTANAMAQGPVTTDEARDLAAKASHQQALDRAFEPPMFEPVAIGDYRAAAGNESRIAQFVGLHRSLQAHMDGARTAPVMVVSETTAREEASRVSHERDMDRYAAQLQASPNAWAVHKDVVQEMGPLAQR